MSMVYDGPSVWTVQTSSATVPLSSVHADESPVAVVLVAEEGAVDDDAAAVGGVVTASDEAAGLVEPPHAALAKRTAEAAKAITTFRIGMSHS
jgi:hypothetical protein